MYTVNAMYVYTNNMWNMCSEYKVMCIYGCVEYGCMCKAIYDVMFTYPPSTEE